MPRALVISSVAGLAVCAISLGLAVRIGGDDIFHDSRSLGQFKPLIDLASHKTWRWGGGDTLALDAPIKMLSTALRQFRSFSSFDGCLNY